MNLTPTTGRAWSWHVCGGDVSGLQRKAEGGLRHSLRVLEYNYGTMFRWVKQRWWLCIVIGATVLIIGWQKKRCDAQEQKCRADYAAQEARLYGFSVDGDAAEQEAINQACEPSGEFCRAFSGANLPTWLLVLVGIGGVLAALRTIGTLEKQANAAMLNAQAVINAERPWFVVSLTLDESGRRFSLSCLNQGNTPGKIISMSADYCFVDKPEDLPIPPVYSSAAVMPDLSLIVHRDSFPIGKGIDPEHVIGQNDRRESVYERIEFLAYYGNVVYRDTLYPESSEEGNHESRWCFIYEPSGLPKLTKAALAVLNPVGTFARSGPVEYNGYT